MADNLRISQLPAALRGTDTPNRNDAVGGFSAGGRRQVNVTQPMAGDEFQRAIAKLNKNLDSGTQLRTDVPRGFYLNIRV